MLLKYKIAIKCEGERKDTREPMTSGEMLAKSEQGAAVSEQLFHMARAALGERKWKEAEREAVSQDWGHLVGFSQPLKI